MNDCKPQGIEFEEGYAVIADHDKFGIYDRVFVSSFEDLGEYLVENADLYKYGFHVERCKMVRRPRS